MKFFCISALAAVASVSAFAPTTFLTGNRMRVSSGSSCSNLQMALKEGEKPIVIGV
eukprot:CAMPEP_0172493684 /NCGR_PEP_ID=MMETSP1066-20121228/26329_1 /TAXON_ID=671091 /ORGANISM="Coscinodiscus wailesii, Strain CCMP2513" /LENGTH=55 /DNA_ID=CAMNT_0013263939 /DNA_START=57 /DNA_END=220 /DNA_ORIENTATION=-